MLAFFGVAALVAAQTPQQNQPQGNRNQIPQGGTQQQTAQPNGQQQQIPPDVHFIMGAQSGGNFEVESSRLALQRSQDANVKKIAQKMIDDHQKCNQQLMEILNKQGQAGRDGQGQANGQPADRNNPAGQAQGNRGIQGGQMNANMRMDPIHAAMMQKLNYMSGQDFDDCYIGMQVLAHEEAVMCFRKAVKKLQDPQLKEFAQKTLPHLKEHLEMVRSAADSSLEHGNYESMKFPISDKDNKHHDQ